MCESTTFGGASGDSTANGEPSISAAGPSSIRENPLWPRGVRDGVVTQYVDEILRDPSINIAGIPDFLEAMIYRSTVKLVLDLVYKGVSKLHGVEVGGHRLLIELQEGEGLALAQRSGANLESLDRMVDRLMLNEAVNSSLVPDFLERQIYANCLKLVFRIVDALAATLKLQICGSELRLEFVKLDCVAGSKRRRLTANIDDGLVRALADDALKDQPAVLKVIPFYRRFVCDVHRAILVTALAVLDDLLAETQLQVLDECVALVLAPSSEPLPRQQKLLLEPPPRRDDADLEAQLRRAQRQARWATGAALAATALLLLSPRGNT